MAIFVNSNCGNWVSRLLPSVSAVMPVLSEMKNAVRFMWLSLMKSMRYSKVWAGWFLDSAVKPRNDVRVVCDDVFV